MLSLDRFIVSNLRTQLSLTLHMCLSPFYLATEMNETAGTPNHPFYEYFLLMIRVTSNTDKLLFRNTTVLRTHQNLCSDLLYTWHVDIDMSMSQYVNFSHSLYCVLLFVVLPMRHTWHLVSLSRPVLSEAGWYKSWKSLMSGYNFWSAKVQTNYFSLLDRFLLNFHNCWTNNAIWMPFKIWNL